jgi:hypothetical protein
MGRSTAALAERLSSYLSVRVQEICREYGVPDDRVRLDLALPDLFTDRLDRILERVDKAERFAGSAGRFTATGPRAPGSSG